MQFQKIVGLSRFLEICINSKEGVKNSYIL